MREYSDVKGEQPAGEALSRQVFGYSAMKSLFAAALVVVIVNLLVSGAHSGKAAFALVPERSRVSKAGRWQGGRAGATLLVCWGYPVVTAGAGGNGAHRQEIPGRAGRRFSTKPTGSLGNLEGAVGSSSECLKGLEPSLCFAIPATSLEALRQAGFRVLGMANNHSGDLGEAGLNATRQALNRAGLGALSFETSPGFWRFGTVTVGVVAFSMVAGADSPAGRSPIADSSAEAAPGAAACKPGGGLRPLGK